MAVMALKSMKTKQVMKAKQVIKAKKAVKTSTAPKTAKTKSLKTVMKMVNTKSKAKEFFRVVDFLHLGLGLKLGSCYTRSHMQKLCAGDRSKLKQLARYMEDPTRLQLEWLTPKSSHENIIAPKSQGGAVCAGKITPKPVPKLSEVNQSVSKKATQKESGHKKAKSILTKVLHSKIFAKKQVAGPTGAATGQFVKTLAKTSWNAKAEDESILSDQRRKKLSKLSVEDLQELHKTNDLRTESVKDFVLRVKARFMSKKVATLQSMCSKRKLATSGNKATLANRLVGPEKDMLKTKMIEGLLIFEADARKQEREQSALVRGEAIKQREKVYSATAKLKKQLEAKSHDALTAHLRDYGLKVSGSKSEKVERVVARMRKDGEAQKIIAARASKARARKLKKMDPALLMLECVKTDEILNDSHFKKMIIDRLVLTEESRMTSQK